LFKPLEQYIIPNILPASELLLLNDIYLVVLYATRIPPHLAISVNGKLYTLTVKGATVDGELKALLKMIHHRNIDSIFIKLSIPPLFTLAELNEEIRKHTLAYPRVDVGIATCLSPIRDFCSQVYETEFKKVNFLFELLPELYKRGIVTTCYQLNLHHFMIGHSFYLSKYTMNDIYEGIRSASSLTV
jgi:hypothetical protein